MKQIYLEAFNKLIELVECSRDVILNHHEKHENEVSSLFFLGDKKYSAYSSMVEVNEFRAAKTIESLAVALFSETNNTNHSLYPVEQRYKKLPKDEQAKSRPFQIILTESGKKYGVIFSNISDISEYIKTFEDGKYAVDALKIVVFVNPDELARDTLFTSVNKFNKSSGIWIERIPVLDFWKQYFGYYEYEELISFCMQFNDKAKTIIGFNTVVNPTEKALQQFREKNR